MEECVMPQNYEQYGIGNLVLCSGFEVLYIKNVNIEETVNEHGKMTVRFLTKEQVEDTDILRCQGSTISLHTCDGDVVFVGVCEQIQQMSQNEYTELEVTAITTSILTDKEKKDHTFQDTAKTMMGVLSKGIAASALVQIDEDVTIQEMLSQKQETDWLFARRIANQYRKQLFVNSKTTGCQIHIGNLPFKAVEVGLVLEKGALRTVDKVRRIQGNTDYAASVFEYEETLLTVSNLAVGVGYQVLWNGRSYTVIHSRICCIKGLIQNELTLVGESGIGPSADQSMQAQGIQSILTGTVVEIDGNMVQVDFGEEGDSPRWVPYANTVNNYFYCMPDKGDTVFVYYETGDSDKMVCLGSKHVNDSPDFDRYQDKMLTANNRMIKFSEQSLELIADRKTYDGEGENQAKITFREDTGIEIQADLGIVFETSEKGSITLCAGTPDNEKRKKLQQTFQQMHTAGNVEYIVSGGTAMQVDSIEQRTQQSAEAPLALSAGVGQILDACLQQVNAMVQPGIISIYGTNEVVLQTGDSCVSFIGDVINIKTDCFKELGTDRSKTYEHLEKENYTWRDMLLDGTQLVLDIVGALPIPGVATAANLVNAGISLARGNYADAAMSAAMAVASFAIGANSALKAGQTVSKVGMKAAKAVQTVDKVVKGMGVVGKMIKGTAMLIAGASMATVVGAGIKSTADIVVAIMNDEFTLNDPECRKDVINVMRGASILWMLGSNARKDRNKNSNMNDDLDINNQNRSRTNNDQSINTTKDQGNNPLTSHKDLDPVDMVTGGYSMQQCDFIINDITGRYIVERSYESLFAGVDSPLGKGWYLSIFGRAVLYDDRVEIVLPDNHTDTFIRTEEGFRNRRGGSCKRILTMQEDNYVMKEADTGLSYVYDADGKLQSVTDRNGNERSYLYTGDTLRRVTFASGQYLDLTWEGNRLSTLTDCMGRKVSYCYEKDRLIEVQMVNGGVEQYTYDTLGRITEITNACHTLRIHNEYDQKGRVTRQTLPNGQEYIMLYNDDDRTNTCLVPANHKEIKYIYNKDNYLIKTEYTDGTTEERIYDQWENIIFTKDRSGRQTQRTYNEYGNLLEEIKPNGLKTTYEYDTNGNCIHICDNAGLDIHCKYDSSGNLLYERAQVSDVLQREVFYSYDRAGRITSFTDANGNCEWYKHDSNFWESTTFINAGGSEYEHQLDKAGRCVCVRRPDGVSTYAYNAYDILCMETNPLGYTTRYLYNDVSDLVGTVRPNHHVLGQAEEKKEVHIYDSNHRLLTTIDETGAVYAVHRDGEGNIIKEINPNTYDQKTGDGEGIVYTYNADDKAEKTQYPNGMISRRWYDLAGNVIKVCHPSQYDKDTDSGQGYTYQYDCMNNLIQVTAPDHTVLKRYVYDLHGRVVKEINARGMSTGSTDEERIGILYTYNYLGWLTQRRIPVSEQAGKALYQLTKYQYDKAGNCVQERRFCEYQTKDSEAGIVHTIDYAYDANDRLVKVSDCTGAVLEYHYDSSGRCIFEKQKINATTEQIIRYQYDAGGRLVELNRTADKEGCGRGSVSVTYTYDKNGNTIKTILPAGAQILREYDAADRLIAERHIDKTGGIDNTTQFAYDKSGNLISITDNRGRKTIIEYDLMNREIKRTERDGSVTRQFYNADGQLEKVIRPNEYERAGEYGKGLQYTYNAQGNILTVIRPDGTIQESNIYDVEGNLLHTQDGTGNGVDMEYDFGGRRTKITTQGKASQQYRYDARGNIIGATDAVGHHTEYILDKWGRIIEIRQADGSSEFYGYDDAGNITRATDGEGNTTTYTYNSLNQLAVLTDPTGSQEIYHYDKEGRLCKKIDRNGTEVSYTYNLYNNPTGRTAKKTSGEQLSERYEYTPEGLLQSAIAQGMRYTYTYDTVGRPIEKKASGRTLLTFAYDRNGNLIHQTDVTGKRTEYRYNEADKLTQVWDNGERIASYEYNADDTVRSLQCGSLYTEYTYNADRSLTSLKTLFGTEVLVDNHYTYDGNGNRLEKQQKHGTTRYQYDSMNRLVQVEYPDTTEKLFYDKAGNRTRRVYRGEEEVYQYDSRNRLTTYTKNGISIQYQYDSAGNLTKDDHARYEYDALNRNTKAETFDGNVQINHYDAEGLRYEMEENGRLVSFIYRGDEIITEKNQEGIIRYIRTKILLASDAESAKTYYHYVSDEMSSITHVVEDKADKLCNEYEYDAWGNVVQCREQIENRFRYNGQQYDPLTQQYYLRARYYNPVIGRFIQEDTYRGDGLNLYAYCHNNPVYYVDPNGHESYPPELDNVVNKVVQDNHTVNEGRKAKGGGNSKKGELKKVQLPTQGKIRYVPPKKWVPSQPLPKSGGKKGGYIDKFGNIWTPGPTRTAGESFEWDVQLSTTGKQKMGWLSRDGSHLNVSLKGKITHK